MKVRVRGHSRDYRSVWYEARTNRVHLIEQRLLPHHFKLVHTANHRETARAIRDMIVRGAPAIAATAAYGLAQGLMEFKGGSTAKFEAHKRRVFKVLKEARPTAVDPVNAMLRILAAIQHEQSVDRQQSAAIREANRFADDSVEECAAIGRYGAGLIRNGMRILTHCNAGWLACVDIGTATAPMYAAQAKGGKFHVYCDETRPRCQGATLTAWELAQQGVSHQVIADNAAGHLMQRGHIDMVIVGSDRTLGRTGEVANKIGTYTKAVLAKRHDIPFYVAIPLSTIDWDLLTGTDIPIEEREESEVLGAWGVDTSGRRLQVRVANPSSGACNPGFDVTPPELITGIITPNGIYKPRDLWKHRTKLGFQGRK